MKPHNSLPARSGRESSRTGALWIPLITGLILMLLAALSAAEDLGFSAHRTERFQAALGPGAIVKIENVSGDIVASAGRNFQAVVTTTVSASSQERANEILGRARILQSQDANEYLLETRWSDFEDSRDGRSRRRAPLWVWRGNRLTPHARGRRSTRCADCRINARYEIVLPAGVRAVLETVNGDVRVQDMEGDADLQSINGNVHVRGARKGITVRSVNGKINVEAQSISPGSAFDLNTVNGSVVLTLPKDAQFELSASTMSGAILSSFPLPHESGDMEQPARPKAPERVRPPRPPRRVLVREGEDGTVVVDLKEIERELEGSMKHIETEIRQSVEEGVNGAVREIRVFDPRRQYTASIGQGGASLRLSTLNGSITLLASGTTESDAKPLVSQRRSFVVTVPRIELKIPRIRVEIPKPVVRIVPAPRPAHRPNSEFDFDEDESVVRGDVSGDFLSTRGGGSYKVGNISGRVKILTHAGEIHVGSAGGEADLKSYGGDIRIGAVKANLKARTLAGDIRAGPVSGSASIETSGGDIRIEEVGGRAKARTGGGDIILPSVSGSVEADTGGGDVRVGIVSRDVKGEIAIRNAGGDVTLTLPADFRCNVELHVIGSPGWNETLIRTDFPALPLTRKPGSQHVSGTLNGGGTRVFVQTHSGSIRLKKGPSAGS